MFSQQDGDALVGRTVAQLKLDADEFDIIAPHFSPETLIELYDYGWDFFVDGYINYPESFQRVVPFLLASLVYKGHLQELLHVDHPLFSHRIFTSTSRHTIAANSTSSFQNLPPQRKPRQTMA